MFGQGRESFGVLEAFEGDGQWQGRTSVGRYEPACLGICVGVHRCRAVRGMTLHVFRVFVFVDGFSFAP